MSRAYALSSEPVATRAAPVTCPPGLRVVEVDAGEAPIVILAFPVHESEDPKLSPAERIVVTALVDGKSNAAIGRERGTSVRTVANQVASIYRKLRVGSRAELVATCAVFEE